jgi:hypothetical protein
MMMMFGGVCDNAVDAYRMMEYAMELIAMYGGEIYDDYSDEDDDDWRCGT